MKYQVKELLEYVSTMKPGRVKEANASQARSWLETPESFDPAALPKFVAGVAKDFSWQTGYRDGELDELGKAALISNWTEAERKSAMAELAGISAQMDSLAKVAQELADKFGFTFSPNYTNEWYELGEWMNSSSYC